MTVTLSDLLLTIVIRILSSHGSQTIQTTVNVTICRTFFQLKGKFTECENDVHMTLALLSEKLIHRGLDLRQSERLESIP